MYDKYKDFIHKYGEQKLIEMLKNKEYSFDVNELLKWSIFCCDNKLVEYLLDNEKIDFNYSDDGWDFIIISVFVQNLEAIKLLEKKGFNLQKEYDLEGRKNVLYFIKDLDTLKYFENIFNDNEIRKALSYIISDTVITKDLELLKYILSKYKINSLSEMKCGNETIKHYVNEVKRFEKEQYDKYKDNVDYLKRYNNEIKPYYEYLDRYLEVKK